MLLQDDDRVHDLAERDALVEASVSPLAEFSFDSFGLRTADPVAEMIEQLKDALLEILPGNGSKPGRPRIARRSLATSVVRRLAWISISSISFAEIMAAPGDGDRVGGRRVAGEPRPVSTIHSPLHIEPPSATPADNARASAKRHRGRSAEPIGHRDEADCALVVGHDLTATRPPTQHVFDGIAFAFKPLSRMRPSRESGPEEPRRALLGCSVMNKLVEKNPSPLLHIQPRHRRAGTRAAESPHEFRGNTAGTLNEKGPPESLEALESVA